ncbi:MAG: hypothetical protein ACI9K2_007624, partial [Myxococcota bacterium]
MHWLRATVHERPWLFPAGPVLLAGAAMLGALALNPGIPCLSPGIWYGVWLDRCPVGDLRLAVTVDAHDLVRGGEGVVKMDAQAVFVAAQWPVTAPRRRTLARGVGVRLAVVDADGVAIDGLEVGSWDEWGSGRIAKVGLPRVPDGDYRLQATVDAGFETVTVEADLPLYAPAVVHLLPDRPLYRPGQDVLLRSVTLRRDDLAPVDPRPGRWRIMAPDGTEMLVERGRTGAAGVADTQFPLGRHAPHGTWRATWETGADADTITFDVRPFALPRFTVELAPDAPWYTVGERVTVEGVARYSSGAPVAGRPVAVTVRPTSGVWPPPLAWEGPLEAVTDASGRFSVPIGEVPSDLVGRSTLRASARVVEEAGEQATGRAELVLSVDALRVEAVTELGDGLVGGFNNRAYLRVTTPDGRPLPQTPITVRNPWEVDRAPQEATTDVDGVASLQLDPGEPISVRQPVPPVRVRPLEAVPPSLARGRSTLGGASLSLAERRALDSALPQLASCADFAVGTRSVAVGLAVDAAGTVRNAVTSAGVLEDCVAAVARRVRFPAGEPRTLDLEWSIPAGWRPSLQLAVDQAGPPHPGVAPVLASAALRARRCLPVGSGRAGEAVLDGHWVITDGTARVQATWVDRTGHGLPPSAVACVRRNLAGLTLAEPSEVDAVGTVRLTLHLPAPPGSTPPQPILTTGYELEVALADGGGQTRAVLPVGAIPALRLRASPSLLRPGEAVTVELLRGPGFTGSLPKWLYLRDSAGRSVKSEVDPKTNTAAFTVPEHARGFLRVEHGSAQTAVVFVQTPDPLSVSLTADAASYAPGATATLTVRTAAGASPTAAAVGLVGVDSTLAQLAPLPGPADWGRVTVGAEAAKPAFG